MTDQGFALTSPAFVADAKIPAAFTCDDRNISPELHWIHPPKGTRSFALIVDDPDAPKGTFTHWVLFNIPADVQTLAQDVDNVGVNGRNDFQQNGYAGPCPPPNHGKHRYYFRLFALDVDSLDLKEGTNRDRVEQVIKGHILGQAELMGLFERTIS